MNSDREKFDAWLDEYVLTRKSQFPPDMLHACWQASRRAALEEAAIQWDGCFYEGVGERIDIGAAIRALSKKDQQ